MAHTYQLNEMLAEGYEVLARLSTGAQLLIRRDSYAARASQPQKEHFRLALAGGATNDMPSDVHMWAMPDIYMREDRGYPDIEASTYYISWGSSGWDTEKCHDYAREHGEIFIALADFIDQLNTANLAEFELHHADWLKRKKEWDAAVKKEAEKATFLEMRNLLRLNDHYLDTEIFVLDRVAIELDGFSPAVFSLYEVTGTDTARQTHRINGTSAIGVGDARTFLKDGTLGGLLVRPSRISRVRPATVHA